MTMRARHFGAPISKKHAAEYHQAIERELARIHLQLHPKKCRVVPVSRGFKWLGFRMRVKPSGKILVTLNKDKIYHERRKLKKMVRLVKAGKLPRETADTSIQCWAAHAAHGNNYNVIKKMYISIHAPVKGATRLEFGALDGWMKRYGKIYGEDGMPI